MASLDPVALDLAAVHLMGFDPARIPKIQETMTSSRLRVTAVRNPRDVEVAEAIRNAEQVDEAVQLYALGELRPLRRFVPHPGWLNHIEAETDENLGIPPEVTA